MDSTAKKKSKTTKESRYKRKRKSSKSDADEPAFLSSKYAEPPTSKIYNSRIRKQMPAEVCADGHSSLQLFRKDLISAMKLPDSEPLDPEDYWLIEDAWKPEWEKGVQVPVDPDSLPEPSAVEFRKRKNTNFKLPRKFIHTSQDVTFSPNCHILSFTSTLANQTCRYDMDDNDSSWLEIVNEDRDDFGLEPIEEATVEKVIEEVEDLCHDNMQESLRSDPSLNLDSDEDALCDVCRSPDSEVGNEIVFCDSCNICVHQSCYGITRIPEGSWICRTCTLGMRPSCVFCPIRGGAMKPTQNGERWCHVSCAIWHPEVTIGCVEKMEPITMIARIPPFRWSLTCCICEVKCGACIQCSIKDCNVSYHVTCAFKEGFRMRAIMSEKDDDVLKLKSYCLTHAQQTHLMSDSDSDEPYKKEIEMTSAEGHNKRERIMRERESTFFKYASLEELVSMCPYEKDVVETIYNYWILKRKSNMNRPLLMPRESSVSTSSIEENGTYSFVKKMVTLRRDLERARNLCYMITKREKVAKSWVKIKHDTFQKQVNVINSLPDDLTKEEYSAIMLANYGDLTHDKIHTGTNGPSPTMLKVLNVLIGEENTKTQLNGILKMSKKNEKNEKKNMPNPYAKHYLNGLLKRSQRWLATAGQRKWENADSSSAELSPDGKRKRRVSFTSASEHTMSDDDNIDPSKATVVVKEEVEENVIVKQEVDDKTGQEELNEEIVVKEEVIEEIVCNNSTTDDMEMNSYLCSTDIREKSNVSGSKGTGASNFVSQRFLVNPNKLKKLSVQPVKDQEERKAFLDKVKKRKFLNTQMKKNLNDHLKPTKRKKQKIILEGMPPTVPAKKKQTIVKTESVDKLDVTSTKCGTTDIVSKNKSAGNSSLLESEDASAIQDQVNSVYDNSDCTVGSYEVVVENMAEAVHDPNSVGKLQQSSDSESDHERNTKRQQQLVGDINSPVRCKTRDSPDCQSPTQKTVQNNVKKTCLTGYKIPKKPRSTLTVEDEKKRGSSPLSPLTSIPTITVTTNSYMRHNKASVTRDLMPKFTVNHKNSHNHNQPLHQNQPPLPPPPLPPPSLAAQLPIPIKPVDNNRENFQWRTMSTGERVEVPDGQWRPTPYQQRPFHPRYSNPNYNRLWDRGRGSGCARRPQRMPFGPVPNPRS